MCCSASTASAAGPGPCAGRPHPKPPPSPFECAASELPQVLGPAAAHLAALAEVVADATGRPLLRGNRITPLHNGDEAYPAMIAAIDEARDSVLFSTYIFDNDRAGALFLEAFRRAVARRVEVRVLIDGLGARYSWPSVIAGLSAAGVRVARFLPKLIPARFRYANLRNHRKIMVVDGRVGFTGGMNMPRRVPPGTQSPAPGAGPALPGRRPRGGPPPGSARGRLGVHHGRAPARAAVVPAPGAGRSMPWRGASPMARTRTSSGCA